MIFAGYTHPQAIVLAERLLALFSGWYSHAFYSDNGSTSVEVALKMSLQMQGEGKKILAFSGAYHGDTFGAMAAAGKSPYHKPFWPYLFKVESIIPPSYGNEEESWEQFHQAIKQGDIGAFIFEPLIQGAAGMRPYSSVILSKMVLKCKEMGILTIADEVMTGFGRTGPLFASSVLEQYPDLICLSKGLTGGFLPMGATLVTKLVHDAFLSTDKQKAFLHGHSYTGNPLACAAANASLDLLLHEQCTNSRQAIEKMHLEFQKSCEGNPNVIRCSVLGTILAIEYQHKPRLRERLIEFFRNAGVLIRPLDNVLYLLPPYCIKPWELRRIYALIEITIKEW